MPMNDARRSFARVVLIPAVLGANPWSSTADLAFDPDTNTLFGVKPFGHQLIVLDPATGVGTTVGDLDFDLIEAAVSAVSNDPARRYRR